MKNWELQMKAYYDKARRTCSYNIEHMFLAFDKIAQEAFKTGDMKEGDSFTVSITDGSHYKFKFLKDMPEIYGINSLNFLDKTPILAYNDKDTAEQYREKLSLVLKTIGTTLHISNQCFGERFPEKLRSGLMQLKPGMVISFNNGPKYVCINKKDDIKITLQCVYKGSLKDISYNDIKRNANAVELDLSSPKEMQKFFENNTKDLTQRMEMSVSFLSDAEDIINNIEQQVLQHNNPFKIFLGITEVTAKPSKTGDECIWFDSDMNRITKDDVVLLRALMDCSPYERNYIHKELQTDITKTSDSVFEQSLENLTIQHKYKEMYNKAIDYVKNNHHDLMIEMLHFNKEGNDFIPTGVYFAVEDDVAKAFKVTYKDNNFNKDEEKIEELSQNEFEKICEQIYHDKFEMIHTRTEELSLAAILKAAEEQNMNIEQDTVLENSDFKTAVREAAVKAIRSNPQLIKANPANVNTKDLASLIHDFMKKEKTSPIAAKKIIDDLDGR